MIGTLHIKNIGIIEDLSIDLNQGLNVLTGETGAGKTLIIDSEAIKQEITERVNNKAIYMEALQYELDNIDEALTQYEEINKQVQAFKNDNSYIIREALKLDFKF